MKRVIGSVATSVAVLGAADGVDAAAAAQAQMNAVESAAQRAQKSIEAVKRAAERQRDIMMGRASRAQRELGAKVGSLASAQAQTRSALGVHVQQSTRKMIRMLARRNGAAQNSRLGKTFRMRGMLEQARKSVERSAGIKLSAEQLKAAVARVQGGSQLFGFSSSSNKGGAAKRKLPVATDTFKNSYLCGQAAAEEYIASSTTPAPTSTATATTTFVPLTTVATLQADIDKWCEDAAAGQCGSDGLGAAADKFTGYYTNVQPGMPHAFTFTENWLEPEAPAVEALGYAAEAKEQTFVVTPYWAVASGQGCGPELHKTHQGSPDCFVSQFIAGGEYEKGAAWWGQQRYFCVDQTVTWITTSSGDTGGSASCWTDSLGDSPNNDVLDNCPQEIYMLRKYCSAAQVSAARAKETELYGEGASKNGDSCHYDDCRPEAATRWVMKHFTDADCKDEVGNGVTDNAAFDYKSIDYTSPPVSGGGASVHFHCN